MSCANFLVKAHRFPAQHIREYSGGLRSRDEDIIYLEAKQYIPRNNLEAHESDLTILAAHAIGFPKELYEPLWDDMLKQWNYSSLRIRSIWIADASNQGASSALNEAIQGDDPSFFDHPRDLLHMINTLREHFPPPLVGVGHSSGATALIQLTLLHPRLLSSLVLFDPIIGHGSATEFATMFYRNTLRPDLWSSRSDCEQYFRSLWRTWDPRVYQLFLQHNLHETPTLLHPEPGKVTLRTTKAQEAWMYGRSCFGLINQYGDLTAPEMRTLYPDLNETVRISYPFYRPEDVHIWQQLPHVRPSILYVFPSSGPSADTAQREAKIDRTGIGTGGSGGKAHDRVRSVVVDDAGHLLPFEKPAKCAAVTAQWLQQDLTAWRERSEYAKQHRDEKSTDQLALSEIWIRQAEAFYKRAKASAQATQKLKAKL
ncbi:hypothetical protein BAUCODRAFT_467173 [Baudoinia panamericana UAMH 10762]|uniref:AB hydrolase-1 domain-containing protein n=1 Tax=Baudoinia panamericana (strain UAMH 10762) TaxID=717646 RepID=M2MXD6_BAUPA|nr:uncharacterized protein BAUCODRAFT_467173 [Baudoinia panamericana UAMH 10762]EMC96223.1 hypothetical protein BAUCODRAFT_467173 [Baudoinia panamericana UAMH 10762]